MSERKDLLDSILEMNIPQADKLALLRAVLLNDVSSKIAGREEFKALLSHVPSGSAQGMAQLTSVVDWMLSLEEVPDEELEQYCELGEFVSAEADNIETQIIFKLLRTQSLIGQGRIEDAIPRICELEELAPEDEEIQRMAK